MIDGSPQMTVHWSDAEEQALALQFVFGAVPPAEIAVQWEGLIDAFVTVGNHGGFVRRAFPPEHVSVIRTATDRESPLKPRFFLTTRGLDVRSLQIVRNLAWSFGTRMHGIVSVDVQDRTPGASVERYVLPLAEWETEKDAYPPLSTRLGFRVLHEDPWDYRKSRRCVIEFGRSVSNDVMEAAIARAREWVALAELGAFSPPVKPPGEAAVWEDVVAAYDECSVELVMSLFEASESSWDVLLNLLGHFSRTVEPVSLVTIE